MIFPVDQVLGREDVIIFHAKPTGTSLARTGKNIVAGIDVDFAFENSSGWISGELIQDEGIVGERIAGEQGCGS